MTVDMTGLKTTMEPILFSGISRLVTKALVGFFGFTAGTEIDTRNRITAGIIAAIFLVIELYQSYKAKQIAKTQTTTDVLVKVEDLTGTKVVASDIVEK